MIPWGPVLGAVGGLAEAANTSAPTSLETDLRAKNESAWGSSFAVGSGATANSSPSVSSGSGLGIPKEYLIGGGIIAAALALAIALR